ncbi:fimbria/pilus periplasmic chaperone [Citrobacter koseri]|uniref:fimbria/pilus periplasmic chaperone n=1 Tax=Citrobacter koseri TaxID=545 RepID=UPI0019048ACA|nr:fimbria/pilus periplasmic chaperone [Citrobacter koseri]MBJ9122322.1 fimbria/pilus periplasmic chaperone [Citrobacter koseri]MBJ9245690.1 fimbria/pilus periplasmic chaperone [Citrobacter koseri]
MFPSLRNILMTATLLATGNYFPASFAGGIVLNQTRIIYPLNQKQSDITVRNTSNAERYMVQSWVDDASGVKTSDFILTPPLFVSNPGDESSLRLMFMGEDLPTNRESLYYLTVKAIPAIDKDKLNDRNVLMLSAAIRIKLFVRPEGLVPTADKAPSQLIFSRRGTLITVRNPTPYYITLVQIKINGKSVIKSVMVPPSGNATFTSPDLSSTLSYKTMNDFGGMSPEFTGQIK